MGFVTEGEAGPRGPVVAVLLLQAMVIFPGCTRCSITMRRSQTTNALSPCSSTGRSIARMR